MFRDYPGIEAKSAGTDANAPTPLTNELVAEADLIIVMENHHRERIRKKFKQRPPDSRIVILNIPDEYERGDPELIALLKDKVTHRLDQMLGNG